MLALAFESRRPILASCSQIQMLSAGISGLYVQVRHQKQIPGIDQTYALDTWIVQKGILFLVQRSILHPTTSVLLPGVRTEKGEDDHLLERS